MGTTEFLPFPTKERILLMFNKLRLMDLNDQIVKRLVEYFEGRQELVKIDSSTISNPINMTSGVG